MTNKKQELLKLITTSNLTCIEKNVLPNGEIEIKIKTDNSETSLIDAYKTLKIEVYNLVQIIQRNIDVIETLTDIVEKLYKHYAYHLKTGEHNVPKQNIKN